MVRVSQCEICHQMAYGQTHCPRCESAVMEGILADIQKALELGKVTIVDPKLRAKIVSGSFKPLKQFKAELEERKKKEGQQKLWEMGRQRAREEADRAYAKEHPEPLPKIFG